MEGGWSKEWREGGGKEWREGGGKEWREGGGGKEWRVMEVRSGGWWR